MVRENRCRTARGAGRPAFQPRLPGGSSFIPQLPKVRRLGSAHKSGDRLSRSPRRSPRSACPTDVYSARTSDWTTLLWANDREDLTVGRSPNCPRRPSHPKLADHESCALLLCSNVINETQLYGFFYFLVDARRVQASVQGSQWRELEEKRWNPHYHLLTTPSPACCRVQLEGLRSAFGETTLAANTVTKEEVH